MQRLKEITSVFEKHGYSVHDIICSTIKEFKLKTLCHKSGISKSDGFSVTELLCLLLMLPLMAVKSVNQMYGSQYAKLAAMQKDTIYRFKNDERFSWRTFMYAAAKMFRTLTTKTEQQDNTKQITALILDDTTDQRTGYKMENISWVHDHVLGKAVLGFKTLVLTFFDGTSTIPLDFTIHKEKALNTKRQRQQYKKEVKKGSHGEKRRKEASTSKIKQSLLMVRRAIKQGFIPKYLLCDSWFTCKELIQMVRDVANGKMHIIAGIRNDNRKYGYKDGLFNAKEIIAQLKGTTNQRRCRKLGILYYEAAVHYTGVGTVKLAMCRYPHQKKWRIFITTDTSLTFVKMMEIYAIRWTIEVLFRECKQHLNFGKCQSQDFDAQISNTAICFILYALLAYRKRKLSYEFPNECITTGQMVLDACKDIIEKTLFERIFELFEEILAFLIGVIAEHGTMDISQLMDSAEYLYAKEILRSSFLFEQIKSVDNAA